LVAARLFAVVACLTISAALIAISLVIFVLPTLHAVRAWWSARILYGVALVCVLLTFTIFAECGDDDDENAVPSCDSGAGAILNILNVFILLGLIVISYWIEAPETPIMTGLFERLFPLTPATSTTPAAAAVVTATHRHTQKKTSSSDTTTPPPDTEMQVVSGSTRGTADKNNW
jgi:hypothetical protein